jgi:hypothetical protein
MMYPYGCICLNLFMIPTANSTLIRILVAVLTLVWTMVVWMLVDRTDGVAKGFVFGLTAGVGIAISTVVFARPSWTMFMSRTVGFVASVIALFLASQHINSGACDGDGQCWSAIFYGLCWDVIGSVFGFLVFQVGSDWIKVQKNRQNSQ